SGTRHSAIIKSTVLIQLARYLREKKKQQHKAADDGGRDARPPPAPPALLLPRASRTPLPTAHPRKRSVSRINAAAPELRVRGGRRPTRATQREPETRRDATRRGAAPPSPGTTATGRRSAECGPRSLTRGRPPSCPSHVPPVLTCRLSRAAARPPLPPLLPPRLGLGASGVSRRSCGAAVRPRGECPVPGPQCALIRAAIAIPIGRLVSGPICYVCKGNQ
ncbi:uncharacterized protein LOC109364161, partial [Meleagris gallopavo]|uniref:uncharacterized protein LOC109364161 n=1 Tax=Meleagris gallopavo TaxID=9103 RepID=UPI00093E4ADE